MQSDNTARLYAVKRKNPTKASGFVWAEIPKLHFFCKNAFFEQYLAEISKFLIVICN